MIALRRSKLMPVAERGDGGEQPLALAQLDDPELLEVVSGQFAQRYRVDFIVGGNGS